MLRHSLITLYRGLTRHRLYAALNVMGLAVGVAVFLVLFLQVRFETSFDRWIPDAANIYRFTSFYTFPGRAPDRVASSAGAIRPALIADYPQARGVVRVAGDQRAVANGSIIGSERTDYVDPNFFDVLDLPLVAGDRRTALAAPDDLVVTETVARKYFGATAVMGRLLTLYYHGVPHVHRITGVLKELPSNTQLAFRVIAPLTPEMVKQPEGGLAYWGSPQTFTYVRFRTAADAEAVSRDLPRFVARRAYDPGTHANFSKMLRLELTPVTTLHFADANSIFTITPGVDARLVYALGVIGALTLAIAIANYVNLATARSALRAREIALRKVMGATRRDLVIQLLMESVAFAFVATLIGLALTELTLPLFNAIGGTSLVLQYGGSDSVLPWLAGGALLIGVIAGLYPALALSRFEPAPVLASSRTPGGGRMEARVRAALIGAQFVIALLFIVATLVVGAQAQFIRNQDRGFRRDGLILLENVGAAMLAQRQSEMLDALRAIPGVVSATASSRTPGLRDVGVQQVQRPGQKGEGTTIAVDVIADNYLKTYGVTLVAGRMFDRAHATDDIAGPYTGPDAAAKRGIAVMLNESAARVLGFKGSVDAVGQMLVTGHKTPAVPIIGVLRDIQFGSPVNPVEPVFYLYDSQSIGGAVGAVRYAGVSDGEMMARLQAVWRQKAPMVPFLGETAENELSRFYVPDEQRARLFMVGAALAVAIGCIGLYGLASFNTARRVKEIGIRKTLGASTGDILRLLIGQFLRPVIIANLIAWPLAYVVMQTWLSGFNQRIALSPLYFIDATVLTLVIALGAVAGQAYAVARAEPAKALRHE